MAEIFTNGDNLMQSFERYSFNEKLAYMKTKNSHIKMYTDEQIYKYNYLCMWNQKILL